MRVLVLESQPGAADRAAMALEAAAHTVERCHPVGSRGFPCRAIDSPNECPLETQPVDVVLTVRTADATSPSTMEDGVACAIRSFVPLVVTGPAETNPYGPWTTATVEEGADVVGVCAAAATAPLARHSRVASDRLREVLVHHDVAAADTADVEVTRRNGRLRILLRFPNDVPQGVCEAAATHVLASVHALDPAARGTDVSITTIGP